MLRENVIKRGNTCLKFIHKEIREWGAMEKTCTYIETYDLEIIYSLDLITMGLECPFST